MSSICEAPLPLDPEGVVVMVAPVKFILYVVGSTLGIVAYVLDLPD
jgi:hypothetical protein